MSTILSAYCQSAFKEFLLPAVNNSDHTVVLPGFFFGTNDDVSVQMEIVDGVWSFRSSDEYLILRDGKLYFGVSLQGGEVLGLAVDGRIRVTFVVRQTDCHFQVYKKYLLKKNNTAITIGSAKDCVIQIIGDLISSHHAVIHFFNGELLLTDDSQNGTFVNSRVIRKKTKVTLGFGDCVDVFGLRIVALGNIIAVGSEDSSVRVDTAALEPVKSVFDLVSKRTDREAAPVSRSLKRVFHRSPWFISKIETDPVEIDAAPSSKELNQPSALMTLGPSLTMALPMLLGCGVSIVAARSSGMTSSVFMYTGMITAVSSALLGTFWGLTNMRRARKLFYAEEERRARVYGEYLKRSEERIKALHEKNSKAMHERYQSAEQSCAYTADNPALWNRNMRQEDYLQQRIGLGEVPFQCGIIVPKERFSMISDELTERPAKIREQYRTLKDVPVCIDLAKERLIGIVGNRKKGDASAVMQSLAAQIAANNCYTDVKLAFIYRKEYVAYSEEWAYARWLPHVWNETGSFRFIAETEEEAGDVFYELMNIIRSRSEHVHGENVKKAVKPQYIVMVASPELLEGQLAANYLLDTRPEYGVTTVILAETAEELPNECEFIIQNDKEFSGFYHVYDGVEDRTKVLFDVVPHGLLSRFARRLANIEVRETESGGDIPDSIDFLEMYGVSRLQDLNVMERWRKNRTYESMRALIGARAGGVPCHLDIHEKFHGPHGLVAGTTGSGKSETLQTYILSLAVNFSPDDVGFFIIDYKGGGMANLFEHLPHVIGSISNLSGNQVNRAMISIKSENVRRQRIFNEYGVNNINSYTKMYKNGEARIPVPHIFIIIDEFAELKREEPEFMRELISVAQVGRSLGVHLILATQKPGGTVDDNIWSNTRFRLCLRVQDRQDSNDMLHRPDAATIIQAGRCYLQVGNDELFELFQSGWSGAPFQEETDEDRSYDIAMMLSTSGRAALEGSRNKIQHRETLKKEWIASLLQMTNETCRQMGVMPGVLFDDADKKRLSEALFVRMRESGIPFPQNEYNERRLSDLFTMYQPYAAGEEANEETVAERIIADAEMLHRKLPEPDEKTQLEAITEYLVKVADENGYHNRFQLWLPVLQAEITLGDLLRAEEVHNGKKWPDHGGRWSLHAVIGKYDDPENQSQDTVVADLANGGHIAVCGAAGTGKSTFLQTLLFSLILRYPPDMLSIYVIDFSTRMLDAFEGDPHIGGIVHDGEPDRIDKLFTLLEQETEQRSRLFSGGNYAQYTHAAGKVPVPAILVVIDNYADFRAKTDNRYDDAVINLSRTGISNGVFLAVSAGGFSATEIPSRLSENLSVTCCLEMNDRFQYPDVLHELHIEVYPEENVRGRGLTRVEGRILEFQTAIAVPADDDYKRGEAIRQLCGEMADTWTCGSARAIPEIPDQPVWQTFLELPGTIEALQSDHLLPIGYDAKDADVYSVNLQKNYAYTISGRHGSGKTNLLKLLMLAAYEKGSRIVVIDFNGELEQIAQIVQSEYIYDGQGLYAFFKGFIEEVKARNAKKQEWMRQGRDNAEIWSEMLSFERICFFVGDLVSFIETVYAPGDGVPEFHVVAENIIEKGALHNMFWFAALDPDEAGMISGRELYRNYVKDRRGIHFGGDVETQRLFSFDYISFMERGKKLKAGIGLLPSENEEEKTRKVVVPLVRN